MYSLKGFINIPKFIDNNPIIGLATAPATAVLGELSKWGMTFSKNAGEYENTAYPDVSLVAMFSKDSVLGNVKCPVETSNITLRVSQWLFDYITGTNSQPLKNILSDDLYADFFGEISNLVLGDLLSVNIFRG